MRLGGTEKIAKGETPMERCLACEVLPLIASVLSSGPVVKESNVKVSSFGGSGRVICILVAARWK